ncbi:MAG: YadA-like family protein [Variovorax sp.]
MNRSYLPVVAATGLAICAAAASSALAQSVGGGDTGGGAGTAISASAAQCSTGAGTPVEGAVANGSSIAIGCAAITLQSNTLAIGFKSEAQYEGATAIGAGSLAQAFDSVAIGTNARVELFALQGIAIGRGALVASENSVAIGAGAVAEATNASAIAIGPRASAREGNTAIAIGEGARTAGPARTGGEGEGYEGDQLALGTNSVASDVNATAVGARAVASKRNALALGVGSTADHESSVALGTGSAATGATLGNPAFLVGGTAGAEVSIGSTGAERRITHVAAGSSDTDAVNVGQLRSLRDSVATVAVDKWIIGSPTTYAAPSATGTNGTAAGSGAVSTGNNSVALGHASDDGGRANVVSVGAIGNERQVVNVAAGTQGTDAVNVGQLRPFADALGGGASVNGDGSVTGPTYSIALVNGEGAVGTGSYDNVGDALGGLSSSVVNLEQSVANISNGAGLKYFHANSTQADSSASGAESTAMGPRAVASGASSVAVGDGAQATRAGAVALGADAVADRAGMNGQREAVSNIAVASTQGAVSVGSGGGERQITHVAGGTQATDAVNVRQLEAARAGSVRYDSRADGSIDYGNVTLGNGQAPKGTTLSNVAPGIAGTDAVNVDQLNGGLAGARQYTDVKVAPLQGHIDKTAKEASAGTAGAMAMAHLPQAVLAGKSMVSAGVAGFDGQAALAIGVSKLSDNSRWIVKFSGAANSRGKVGVAAGMGFHW